MMTDERNFRSHYYEKVGFRSVEEKKSLEILLKERPLDKTKLKQFCHRFTVPAIYRILLWKILLGITPIYSESHDFVAKQRKIEFHDLRNALQVSKIIDENTKIHEIFLLMWLLKTRRAKIDLNTQLDSPLFRAMNKMGESLCNILQEEDKDYEKMIDIYWLLCGFLDHIQNFHNDFDKLLDCTSILLEKEDPTLYHHLAKFEALQYIPLNNWFSSCFAGTISNGSIPKIWDKITIGAYKILVFVAVVMLMTFRMSLLNCQSIDAVLDTISNINDETSEIIVNNAIDMWQCGRNILSTNQDLPCPKAGG